MYSVVFPLAPGGRSGHLARFTTREDAEHWITYASKWCGPWELYELDHDDFGGTARFIEQGEGAP